MVSPKFKIYKNVPVPLPVPEDLFNEVILRYCVEIFKEIGVKKQRKEG
jgi:hypothetical protein